MVKEMTSEQALELERARAEMDTLDRNAHEAFGPGEVIMVYCPVCGWGDWRSANRESSKHSVVWQSGRDVFGFSCPRCDEMQQRSPEVFNWAMGAITMMGEMLEKRFEERVQKAIREAIEP